MFKSFVLITAMLCSTALFAKENPVVILETNHGAIEVELFEKEAPLSVANFLQYVDSGFYNGLIFHRVISDFMIQGGGFDRKFNKKPTKAPIKNEATNKISNSNGTIAMARTNDVDSATAQFFINVKDNNFLDHQAKTPRGFGYAVFGKVTSGMSVVEKIKKLPTAPKNGHPKVPTTDAYIKSAKRKKLASKK